MLYVDEEFYLNIFRGEPVQEADFPALEERAAELIEEMCRYRINPENFTSYSERIQMLIKKAVCAEIEYLDANGGSEMDNGADLKVAASRAFMHQEQGGFWRLLGFYTGEAEAYEGDTEKFPDT